MALLALAIVAFWVLRVERTAVRFLYEANDLFVYFLPSYTYEAERLRAGSLPMWNPYQGGGEPFLAMLQPGALYPARLLLFAMEPATAMACSAFAHLLLLALATYAGCRALGSGALPALAAAAVWTTRFGVPAILDPVYLEAGAWLPVGVLALQRTLAGCGTGWAILLGAATAMPILAGGYQITVYGLYGLGFVGVALLADGTRRAPLSGRLVVALGLAAILAFGLAAPQLLTTLAWTTETVRRHATSLTAAQIAPFGPVWQGDLAAFPGLMTIPVLVLALVGFARSGRFGVVLGVLAAGAFLVSLGPGTPWFEASRALPGLGLFRFPSRLSSFLVTFLCAVGAAFGIDALATTAGRRRAGARRWLEALLLATVCAAVLPAAKNEARLPWMLPDNGVATGAPPLFDAVRTQVGAGRAALPDQGVDHAVTPKQGMMRHLRVLSDYEPLCSARLSEFLHTLVGLPPPGDDWASPFTGSVRVSGAIARPALLDLAAVRAVVEFEKPGAAPRADAPPAAFAYGAYRLYANDTALPRAYIVEATRFVPDATAALRAIAAPDFDAHREVVLVGAADPSLDRAGREAAPARAATIATDDPELVRIDVAVEHPAVLVLADAFAPGWHVDVDGTSRPVWQANHFVRGVLLRPGDRRVTFTYRAPGFAAGVVACGGSLLLAAVLLVAARRRPAIR